MKKLNCKLLAIVLCPLVGTIRGMELHNAVEDIAVLRAKSHVQLGCLYLEKEDYDSARSHFEQVAQEKVDETSILEATYYLGVLYHSGLSVEKDVPKAVQHYLYVVHNGGTMAIRIKAAFQLAQMYFLGFDGERNYDRPREYYEIIATQTMDPQLRVWSWFRLGTIHALGL